MIRRRERQTQHVRDSGGGLRAVVVAERESTETTETARGRVSDHLDRQDLAQLRERGSEPRLNRRGRRVLTGEPARARAAKPAPAIVRFEQREAPAPDAVGAADFSSGALAAALTALAAAAKWYWVCVARGPCDVVRRGSDMTPRSRLKGACAASSRARSRRASSTASCNVNAASWTGSVPAFPAVTEESKRATVSATGSDCRAQICGARSPIREPGVGERAGRG